MNDNFIISTNGEVLCRCSANAEGTITIPEGIVAIKQNAFKGCKDITNVVFPKTLKRIGSCAFEGCESLKSVQIAKCVKYIGQGAFKGCRRVESADIPSSIEELPDSMFEGCISLTDVKMAEDGLKVIGDYCFKMCISLKKITIPRSVISMGRAFTECWNLKTVIMKTNKIGVNKGVFAGCGEDITVHCCIPATSFLIICNSYCPQKPKLRSIKKKLFAKKILAPHFLNLYSIPGDITTIEEEAFCYCTGLRLIEISQSVKRIENRAFKDCSNLIRLTIKEGVEVIGRNAFENCIGLTNLYLPDSLKVIKDFAFSGCTALTEVSISQYTQVAATAFDAKIKITYRQ